MTTDTKIIYISIGNSDDKLTQMRWSAFVSDVRTVIANSQSKIHGEWFSAPNAPWQNACWCIEPIHPESALRRKLRGLARQYEQDSIAYAVVFSTDMLTPM